MTELERIEAQQNRKYCLEIGDHVYWRGCFGADAPRSTQIASITIALEPGYKCGTVVNRVPLWVMRAHPRAIIVDLKNGHWAYGNQIEKVNHDENRNPGASN